MKLNFITRGGETKSVFGKKIKQIIAEKKTTESFSYYYSLLLSAKLSYTLSIMGVVLLFEAVTTLYDSGLNIFYNFYTFGSSDTRVYAIVIPVFITVWIFITLPLIKGVKYVNRVLTIYMMKGIDKADMWFWRKKGKDAPISNAMSKVARVILKLSPRQRRLILAVVLIFLLVDFVIRNYGFLGGLFG